MLNILKFITNHPLNRKNKLKAIERFVKWQIGSRLVSGTIVYDWINGAKFFVKRGETGLTGNIYTGLHEFEDMGFLLHVLRRDDLFVDVGANAGSYTILSCSVIGARGIAFEPVPSTFERLTENIRLNHLEKNVVAINKGVGDQHGTMKFTSNSDTTNHVLAEGEKCVNPTSVGVTILDSSLTNETPLLIKIDVEGYEKFVLQGAREILKSPKLKAVILELNGSGDRYGQDESEILELMFAHEFKTYSYNPLDRKLAELNGEKSESGNTLFIRDKCFVKKRLETADSVFVNGQQL